MRARLRKRRELLPSLVVGLVILLAPTLGSAFQPNAQCEVCTLRLESHTRAHEQIVALKEPSSHNGAPRLRVRITNTGSHPIVVGGSSPRTRVTLNFVTPRSRGTETVRLDANGPATIVRPRSSISFDVIYPYRLGLPGRYEFNVSYHRVSSNIVTYAVGR